MELKVMKLFKVEELGKRAKTEHVKVGKWYMLDGISAIGTNTSFYGKVVEIIDENRVLCEKVFEVNSYRPYNKYTWYDSLPMGIF